MMLGLEFSKPQSPFYSCFLEILPVGRAKRRLQGYKTRGSIRDTLSPGFVLFFCSCFCGLLWFLLYLSMSSVHQFLTWSLQLILEAAGTGLQFCFVFFISQNEVHQAPRDVGTAPPAKVSSLESEVQLCACSLGVQ